MKAYRPLVVSALLCILCLSLTAMAGDAGNAKKSAAPNPWFLEATLSSSDNPPNFGYAVAISGDTILVAANTSIDVYVRPKAGWSSVSNPAARLSTSDAGTLTAVAISGNTVVAGSTQVDGTGAAYVFVEPSGGWKNMTQTAKLTASDAMAGDFVGISVAISGNTVVVGALQNNSVGAAFPEPNGAGSAYVFVKPAAGWSNMTETAKLTASDGASGDDLGYSVVVQGDTIAAGAPNAVINSTTLDGAIYIFQKNGSQWKSATQNAKLTASDGHEVTALGLGLSINGPTLAAAAFDKAYVFVKPSTGWANGTQNAELGSTAYTFFGLNSIAIYRESIVAGSPLNNSPFADLYVEPSSGWSNMRPTYRFKAPAGNENGADGWSVAINGSNMVVGSPLLDGIGGNAVYVYGHK
jgi:FG-GAP repeat